MVLWHSLFFINSFGIHINTLPISRSPRSFRDSAVWVPLQTLPIFPPFLLPSNKIVDNSPKRKVPRGHNTPVFVLLDTALVLSLPSGSRSNYERRRYHIRINVTKMRTAAEKNDAYYTTVFPGSIIGKHSSMKRIPQSSGDPRSHSVNPVRVVAVSGFFNPGS